MKSAKDVQIATKPVRVAIDADDLMKLAKTEVHAVFITNDKLRRAGIPIEGELALLAVSQGTLKTTKQRIAGRVCHVYDYDPTPIPNDEDDEL